LSFLVVEFMESPITSEVGKEGGVYYVYVIESVKDGSYYIGHSHDPDLRLTHHNEGWTRSTKGSRPWNLVYVEPCGTKGEAMRREFQLKRMKSRKAIEKLMASVRQIRGESRPAPG
jgi:putative endonuclease